MKNIFKFIFTFFLSILFFEAGVVSAAILNGDVNTDGKVDIIDIGIIIDNYGKNPVPFPKADVSGDSVVNIIDVGIVIDNYGKVLTSTPTASTGGGSHTVVAIGDLVCGNADIGKNYPCQAGAVANTIKQISPLYTLLLGDIQYESGSLSDFNTYYEPLLGSLKNSSRPVPGNHEYGTGGAAGYFTYFGSVATPQEPSCKSNCKGYYSFDVGNWHLIALNSECSKVPGGCAAGSPQETWLKADLAKVQASKCILAYWHEARFTSGHGGNDATLIGQVLPFWQDLYNAKADIVLSGHSHNYERFDLQDPNGKKTADGIRQFVVGSGGRDFTGFWNSAGLPNSQVKNNNTFGVLKLTLNQNSYNWQFVPSIGIDGYKNGTFTDSGSSNCH
jgi:hypothetical protein